MSDEVIRVGVVGAGNSAVETHIPRFQSIDGVEVVSVSNRTPESSQRAAERCGIPKVYDNWPDLVAADDINAVFIGTWPYLHKPVTIAALEAGKHVLSQSRMAMNAEEAHEMMDVSRRHPNLVTCLVPTSRLGNGRRDDQATHLRRVGSATYCRSTWCPAANSSTATRRSSGGSIAR